MLLVLRCMWDIRERVKVVTRHVEWENLHTCLNTWYAVDGIVALDMVANFRGG